MNTGQKDNGQEANGCMEGSSQQGGHISFSTILGKGLGAAMCSKGGCLCAENPVGQGAKVPERLAEGSTRVSGGRRGEANFPRHER